MLVIVTTHLQPLEVTTPAVVTLDTRSVVIVGPHLGRAGKVHYGWRTTTYGPVVPRCGVKAGQAFTTWTGKATDITCSRCADFWWNTERERP